MEKNIIQPEYPWVDPCTCGYDDGCQRDGLAIMAFIGAVTAALMIVMSMFISLGKHADKLNWNGWVWLVFIIALWFPAKWYFYHSHLTYYLIDKLIRRI